MSNMKILRTAYGRVPQANLATFAENVYLRTKNVAGYEFLQNRVDAIRDPLDQFKTALIAAQNRGISEVTAKNLRQKEVVRALDLLVAGLEEKAGEDIQLIVNAGFSTRPERAPIYRGNLTTPEILRASSTGRRGEVRIVLKNKMPKVVLMHAVEYSLDGGESWHNGTYHNNSTFTIDGLPASGSLMIRVKALGKGGNKSDWSEPVLVAVL